MAWGRKCGACLSHSQGWSFRNERDHHALQSNQRASSRANDDIAAIPSAKIRHVRFEPVRSSKSEAVTLTQA